MLDILASQLHGTKKESRAGRGRRLCGLKASRKTLSQEVIQRKEDF